CGIAQDPKSVATFRSSRPLERGVSRSSRTLGAGCGGRDSDARRAALMRTAKACGPGTPTLVSSLRKLFPQATVAKEPGHRGERGISRKTIVQGRPDQSGEPVVTCSCALFISHARLRVHRAPGFPCALCFRRRRSAQQLGRDQRREIAVTYLNCLGCLKIESGS